ncbi:hypothetical protein, partial [Oleiphilus sp. HI0043]|uniref:hypothetical protein n=1 Tax=Oleiphilus sp. HI0043 TaxID=1822233 RepID=UPI000A9D7F89
MQLPVEALFGLYERTILKRLVITKIKHRRQIHDCSPVLFVVNEIKLDLFEIRVFTQPVLKASIP